MVEDVSFVCRKGERNGRLGKGGLYIIYTEDRMEGRYIYIITKIIRILDFFWDEISRNVSNLTFSDQISY